MAGTPSLITVSTKQQRIAKLAREMPTEALTSLSQHIDIDWLREAYGRTRKSGAVGIDGQSASEYANKLEENLGSLLDRAKSGRYRAPSVRRVHIPKEGASKSRPIGIPTFEDKVLQRSVVMALEPVYEQDFCDFSYGFRPGRSAHQALKALRDATMSMNGGWVLEVDIQSFFDSLDRQQLRDILRQRVRDGVLVRLVGKWLNAGVMEGGVVTRAESGTPQGGVVSPLLANIYLHEVLDQWWVRDVMPRMRGRAKLIRYCDDLVIVFEREDDARRVHAVLPKRFGRFGLALHPEKTRMLRFERPGSRRRSDDSDDEPRSGSFDFLGFTHYWALSRKGHWVVKQKTAKSRFSRAMRSINLWCRKARHWPLSNQSKMLGSKLRGHYGYFGITVPVPRTAS